MQSHGRVRTCSPELPPGAWDTRLLGTPSVGWRQGGGQMCGVPGGLGQWLSKRLCNYSAIMKQKIS